MVLAGLLWAIATKSSSLAEISECTVFAALAVAFGAQAFSAVRVRRTGHVVFGGAACLCWLAFDVHLVIRAIGGMA
jgi:hypothetical protein